MYWNMNEMYWNVYFVYKVYAWFRGHQNASIISATIVDRVYEKIIIDQKLVKRVALGYVFIIIITVAPSLNRLLSLL